MKPKIASLFLILFCSMLVLPALAEKEIRDVSEFSKISLNVSGKLYLQQGDRQRVEIVAKSSTLEDIVTEVKGGELIIRFKNRNVFWRSFNPGKIEIYVSVPEIEGLSVSGSGDIIADERINSRRMSLAVSGSGNIRLDDLRTDRVKSSISGSGGVFIGSGGMAEDFEASISGSGSVKAEDFEAENVKVHISGSGNCSIHAAETLNVRVAGSGSVYYSGNPQVDSSVSGSGRVRSR
ncbi:MAG: head GIN domain-containing protein, partial [Tangfeifania sp.]